MVSLIEESLIKEYASSSPPQQCSRCLEGGTCHDVIVNNHAGNGDNVSSHELHLILWLYAWQLQGRYQLLSSFQHFWPPSDHFTILAYQSINSNTHTPSHTFTHLQTPTHTFTYLYTPSHTSTHLHTPSHTFTHLHTSSHTFTHLHTPSHTFTHL